MFASPMIHASLLLAVLAGLTVDEIGRAHV